MQATIFIEQLCLMANIGVYAHEKQKSQPLFVDVECEYDIKRAASSDDLQQTLDYDRLARHITAIVQERHYELLEALAQVLLDHLWQQFEITYLRLKLRKPQAIQEARACGIILERRRLD